MTQHTFDHPPYSVMTGWDRPLQRFFLNIAGPSTPEHPVNPLSGLVYSNLDDLSLPKADMTLAQVKAKLDEFGLPIPEGLLEALQTDAETGRTLRKHWS